MAEPDVGYLRDQFGLAGKTVLVTGARQGIGYATALALGRAGARVALTARRVEQLAPAAQALEQLGAEVLSIGLDVRDRRQVEAAMDAAMDEFGRLDVLVNNAGISLPGESLAYDEEDWDLVMDTNLKGTFLCSQAGARRMAPAGGGRIVNLSSTYARAAVAGQAAYAASKAAIEQLTRTLALEWAPSRINVNAVAPTTVLTESRADRFEDEAARRGRLEQIPLGRFAEAEDVVGAILFLAGAAGRFVTGHTVAVDGGYTLR